MTQLMRKIDHLFNKTKFMAYGKRLVTKKKAEEVDEKKIWSARLNLVNKMALEFEGEKDIIRIWKAREAAMSGSGGNKANSIKEYRTGQMLDDLEDISGMLLDSNQETMGKELATPKAALLRTEKEEVIDNLLEEVSELLESIPWAVYMKVVQKVMVQKKGVLDFINSEPDFKVAVYVVLNRF